MSRESKLQFVTIGSQATVDKLRGGVNQPGRGKARSRAGPAGPGLGR